MKVGYVINMYPRVTHSFIRREIQAVEAAGVEVQRYSVRRAGETLVDPGDIEERTKTREVLGVGAAGLLSAMIGRLLADPVGFVAGLVYAMRLGLKSDRGFLKEMAYFAEACVLRGWFREDEVEHVHAHFGTNAADVVLLCRKLGGPPYSFTVHGPEEFDRIEGISIVEKVENAAFVVAISIFATSQLYRWCSFSDYSKIHVVRCGVDPLFLGSQGRPIPEQERPKLAAVGRLCTHKAQLLVIEAMHELAQSGVDMEMVFVGDGEIRDELESKIDEYGLRDRVEITGWVGGEVVQQKLLESRVMVLPSFAEGLPVVIMEAMGLGRPVITTYVAGIPELVEDGRSGWVLTPGDTAALREALRAAVKTSTPELNEMGRVGIERVAEQHDSRKEGAKIAGLFKRYSGRPEAPSSGAAATRNG